MGKTALITGITGQDGAYLAELLLDKGYNVHGIRQPVAFPDLERLKALLGPRFDRLQLHYGDLNDAASLTGLLKDTQPDEIYNLAAQSHVHISFAVPDQTLQVNAAGTLRLLEAIRLLGLNETARFFQASTSELFGAAPPPQTELTPMKPRSPYAAAKLCAYHMVCIYREAYGLHASNGIMFNHESPLRGEDFVTRKIALSVAHIVSGTQDVLQLGNLNAYRDWSHARDIMQGAWLMLQQEDPDDFILSSGQAYSVREFATEAFAMAGMPITWHGQGLNEVGIDPRTGRTVVQVDPALFRPLEVETLLGDATKARNRLGWSAKTPFPAIVRELVRSELAGVESVPDIIAEKLYG